MENDTRRKIDIAKKIIKIVFKILYELFMLMCVLLILIVVFQKISDSNKSIGGYRIFRVVTGSMIPEYDIGEVVISKEIDPHKIEIGNVIKTSPKAGSTRKKGDTITIIESIGGDYYYLENYLDKKLRQ